MHEAGGEVWGARMLFPRPLISTAMERGVTAEDTGAKGLPSLVLVWNAARDRAPCPKLLLTIQDTE